MKKKETISPEEDQTYRIFPIYRRKCDLMGVSFLAYLKELLEKATEVSKFDTLQTFQELGPVQVRALLEAIVDLKYDKLRVLNLYKIKLEDEGLRAICKYICQDRNALQILDVIENEISPLGCDFLGKSLSVPACQLKILKMDSNLIGTEGLKNLTVGLRTNSSITKLSLKNCGIDEKGAFYLQQILANIKTRIRSLKLQGNQFKNKGIYEILRAVDSNQTLEKLNIADTGLDLLDFKPNVMRLSEKDEDEDEQKLQNSQGENPQQQEQQKQGDEQQNPDKRQASINNLKQVIKLPEPKQPKQTKAIEELSPTLKRKKSKTAKFKIKQEEKVQEEENIKIVRNIEPDDASIEAQIMRLLLTIMQNNEKLLKYDLNFNPISNDAAFMLFQAIQDNISIKDVEMNNNVDYELRQSLDTLMRMRTGRMPKGRKGRGKSKAKGKKKKK